jgi:hypothetical protein
MTKNKMIKMYTIIILPVVLHGCESLSLTLREKRRLSVFENRVMIRVFGPKSGKGTRSGESCIMRSLMICIPHPIFFG